MASNKITVDVIIDNWVDEPYMDTLMYQCEETRYISEYIYRLDEKGKIIHQNYVIGLLKKELNDKLLDVYSVEDYLKGIDNLCEGFDTYKKHEGLFIIKKHWMKAKHRKKIR